MAKKSKGKTINVDMTGVEVGGKLTPEGDYIVEVKEVTPEQSDNGHYLKWTLKIIDGKSKGSQLWHNTSLQPQALFNLRNLLESLGVEVPDGALKLDLDEVIGLQCGVTVDHEMYKGKPKARVTDIYSLEEDTDEESGDDDDHTKEDLESMDDEELIAAATELEVEIVYSNKKKKKLDKGAIITAILEAQDADDEEDTEPDADDEDEDDAEDFSDLTDEELLAKAKELEVEVVFTNKKKKKFDREALIKQLEEASEEDDEDDSEDDDSDDEEDEAHTEEELGEMSDEELIALAKELEVAAPSKGKGSKKKLDRETTIANIMEAEESDEEDEELTKEDLEELSDADLIDKATEHDVEASYKGKGSKKKLDRATMIEAILEAADV